MKLWGGRFQKETDNLVNELNASISFDQRLYKEDITGSMAHAKMLGACGIISMEDVAAILEGLQSILEDVEAGKVDTRRTIDMLQKLFTPYRGRLDALVLGCTHYPFASHTISRILGGQVDILDGGDGTARETRRRLEEAGLLRDGPGEVIIENSRNSPEILRLSWRLLEGKSRTEEENHGK